MGSDCDGGTYPRDDLPKVWLPRETEFGDVHGVRESRRTLSDQALDLINGPRQDAYAAPEVNLARIGFMWAGLLDLPEPIPAWRVALLMEALKTARAWHSPTDDSCVDGVGYWELVVRTR